MKRVSGLAESAVLSVSEKMYFVLVELLVLIVFSVVKAKVFFGIDAVKSTVVVSRFKVVCCLVGNAVFFVLEEVVCSVNDEVTIVPPVAKAEV